MTPERWQRIEQLLHSALKLEARRRAAFLKEACGGDEALRSHVARSSRIWLVRGSSGPRDEKPQTAGKQRSALHLLQKSEAKVKPRAGGGS